MKHKMVSHTREIGQPKGVQFLIKASNKNNEQGMASEDPKDSPV